MLPRYRAAGRLTKRSPLGLEIERKFLVADERWRAAAATSVALRQGYFSTGRRAVVRVRLAAAESRGWLTIKGPPKRGVRPEFEYAIPHADAVALLALCGALVVEKTRHRVPFAGRVWEVDEFAGANRPLVLAEIELESVDAAVELPAWIGREVTDDRRYGNSSLARRPFGRW